MQLRPTNIKWVRNVTRKDNQFAYFDIDETGIFTLNWSSTLRSENHPSFPEPGDIIVIVQRSYLTHLVTPVDRITRDVVDKNPEFRWGRNVQVVACAEDKLWSPNQFDLTRAAAKFSFPFSNIIQNQNLEVAQQQIWDLFSPYFRQEFLPLNDIENREDEELAVLEGTERWALKNHKWLERDIGLVREKKREAAKKGLLFCECCDFDFSKAYPNHGDGFIECHHRIPIHQGVRTTTLENLALVCANCHRMLHKKTGNGAFLTCAELRNLLGK